MKSGDLVCTVAENITPCVQIGNFGGQRLMNVYGIPGLVLDIENWWGEDWLKVMFGTEIGWVMHSWVRLA